MEAQIKTLTEAEKARKWVDLCRAAESDELTLSKSGKAVLIEDEFWVPVSLCRRRLDPIFGAFLVAPMWWILENQRGWLNSSTMGH
jgi:hypothetical protein